MFNLNEGLLACLFPEYSYWIAMPWYVLIPAIIAVLAISYLLGSVNSAIIISKVFYGEDVRTKGSGNAGTTNMLRNYGKLAALFTLLGDMLKTALSILLAGIVFGFWYVGPVSMSEMCYIAGLFSVIGHVFPIYYKLRGGKGVLSTATMALILTPPIAGMLILIFVAVVAFTKFVSLGSVIGVCLYPVVLNGYFAVFFSGAKPLMLMVLSTIILAALIVWCHRSNLARISRGEENKLSFSKKKAEPLEEIPEAEDDEEE